MPDRCPFRENSRVKESAENRTIFFACDQESKTIELSLDPLCLKTKYHNCHRRVIDFPQRPGEFTIASFDQICSDIRRCRDDHRIELLSVHIERAIICFINAPDRSGEFDPLADLFRKC